MDQHTRFETFERSHREAVKSIQDAMADSNENVRLLVNWLMTTEANPYGFLPEGWAGAMNEAVGFASLCHHIRHDLLDDGEINFIVVDRLIDVDLGGAKTVRVNGEPRITFAERQHDGIEAKMLTPSEIEDQRTARPGRAVRYEIAFLPGVKAFIAAHDEYEVVTLRRCFLGDAKRDLQHAIAHYGTHPLFQPEWIDEATPWNPTT